MLVLVFLKGDISSFMWRPAVATGILVDCWEMARSESTVACRLQVFWDQTSKSAQIWRPVSFYHSRASCSLCFLQGSSTCSSPTCFNISYLTGNVFSVHPAAQNVVLLYTCSKPSASVSNLILLQHLTYILNLWRFPWSMKQTQI